METEKELKTGCDRLAYAVEQLERKGWTQHNLRDYAGRVCLIGALTTAREKGDLVEFIYQPGMCDAIRFLGFAHITHVADWNDDVNRTKDEVLARIATAQAEHCTKGTENGPDTNNGL